VKFSLDPIERILAALGHPERRYATAIVAGTNGKGSTSAMLASIIQHAGYRTGLYSSPHLIRVNERIRVNGSEITDEEFSSAFTAVCDSVEVLLAGRTLETRPSFFEYLTATAFLHLARAGIDFAVLEVGMGGRLDATNVTEPRVAVITNIELDHQQFLGTTHAAIAAEKAGVIKPARPVVSTCEHTEAARVIRQRAAALAAPLIEAAHAVTCSRIRSLAGRSAFDLALGNDRYSNLLAPLAGRFQMTNAIAAVTAAWCLAQDGWNISPEDIKSGLGAARWPGRLEVVGERPLVVLDGAHNPAAAREIAAFVRDEWPAKRLRLIYASMRDKEVREITSILFPLAEKIFLTRPDLERAARPEEILAASGQPPQPVVIEPDPARALELACQESAQEDIVLAAGSLFLVGALKRALGGKGLESGKLQEGAMVPQLP
jgi:dihydrofolate synthase/folylpolyglutamate synthase